MCVEGGFEIVYSGLNKGSIKGLDKGLDEILA